MALQNLRSSTANKRPVATSLSDGQIALNINAASPGIFFKNSSNVLTKVGPIHIGTSAPNSSPAGSSGNAVGEQWMDTSGSAVVMKVWDGSAWQEQNKFGAVAGTAAAPSIYFAGDTDTGIYSPGANQVAISTGGTGRLFVDSTGNVGIGAQTPQGDLSFGASAAVINLDTSDGSDNKRLVLNGGGGGFSSGRGGYIALSGNEATNPGNIQLNMGNVSGTSIVFKKGDGNEAGRIDSSGRLLVGTSSSTNVAGREALTQIRASGTQASLSISRTDATGGGGGIQLAADYAVSLGVQLGSIKYAGNDGTDVQSIGASIDCFVDGTPGANDMPGRLVFSTTADGASTPTERMRIDSSGNVGIGVTNPDSALHVTKSDFARLRLEGTNSAGTRIVDVIGESNNSEVWRLGKLSSTSNDFAIQVAGSERLRIDSSGRLLVGTSTWSDSAIAVFEANSGGSTGQSIVYLARGNSATSLPINAALGQLKFSDNAGAEFARIEATVDGTTGASDYPGRLVFSTTADGASSPTERMRITSTGRVGIGTATPNAALELENQGDTKVIINARTDAPNGSRAELELWSKNSGGTNNFGFISYDGDDKMEIGTGGSGDGSIDIAFTGASGEAMRIDNSGRLGLGTSIPSAGLTVGLGSGSVPAAGSSGSSGPAALFGNSVGLQTYGLAVGATTAGLGYIQAQRADGTATTYNLTIQPNGGNVGIGTTSPSAVLDVFTGTNRYVRFSTNGDASLIRTTESGGANRGFSVAGEYIKFDTGTNNGSTITERARIDSSGRLLVGTSSARSTFNTNQTLQVQLEGTDYPTSSAGIVRNSNNSGAPAFTLGKTRGTTAGSHTVVNSGDDLGTLSFEGADGSKLVPGARITAEVDGTPGTDDMPGRLVFSTTADAASSPTERLRITNAGVLYSAPTYNNTTADAANVFVSASGQFYRSTSSGKYKTNVETIEDIYSDSLLSIRPVWYRSLCPGDDPSHSYWGFIAEEVAAIDPRLVHWKTVEVTYDEKGSAIETPCDPEPEGVAYDRFVPHLLNLIKRQKEQIEALEARLSALEGA